LPAAALAIVWAIALITGCSSVPKEYADPEGVVYRDAAHNLRVWVADGFDFGGYAALHVAPTGSSVPPLADAAQAARFGRLQEAIRTNLIAELGAQRLVASVTPDTLTADVEGKVLKLETDVVDYYAGSMTERILVGFGAGSPYVMVRGKLTDLASGRRLMCFLVKRGFEGLDLGVGNESVLRQQIRDLAKDTANIAGRVKDRRPLH
jgi:hypothetical protein